MAGHMGDEQVTLRSVPLLDIWQHDGGTYLVMKGSVPGCYSGYVHLVRA
jgi:ribosomal protein L3